jgi:hypothetical protein
MGLPLRKATGSEVSETRLENAQAKRDELERALKKCPD